jgi:peptidylprolyl isomerase
MLCLVGCSGLALPLSAQEREREGASRTAAEVTAFADDSEWRSLDPENTLHIELPGGEVVLELAPAFAPRHVENIRALVRGGYFDGGAITRSQDNYVVQWGPRPLAQSESLPGHIASSLPSEFEVAGAGLPFTPIPDGDVYAPEAGFVRGFPAGRDPESGATWMAHCYGVVGVARGNDPGSGNGGGLYVVIGHAPRHLDRNLSMVGRVVAGMEHLSTLPRGTGGLGRYESRDQWVLLESVQIGSDRAPGERSQLQILRTDSQSFQDLIMAARSRNEEFFVYPSDRIGLCNIPVPTRTPGSD